MLPEDICPRSDPPPDSSTQPYAPPIFPAGVWRCDNVQQAESLLAGSTAGYVYQRDGHPNADMLAHKCRELHGAPHAAVMASGMGAAAVALLSQLQQGDHVLVSNQLYGRTAQLFTQESKRLGIESTLVDPCRPDEVKAHIASGADLLIVETIANPLLRVADIAVLAEIAHDPSSPRRCRLLVDNTFATPILCRPLVLGADLVLESISKMMNGHGDVMLGLLCGAEGTWDRVPLVLSAWGLASSPFDCWLAQRGLMTLPLRAERASQNALQAAKFLAARPEIERVDYPGLPDHPDHELADRQFQRRFGSMIAFHLCGREEAASRFISAARRIPFCPSLGDASTTLSHPASTSHRGFTPQQRAELGITDGTIRLSVGVESIDYILECLEEGL